MNTPEEILAARGFYAAAVHGSSMHPLLAHLRDSVYIESATDFRRLDVVLFRRENGQLVLHRIIGKTDSGLIICGDNDFISETVPRERIIGVMTEFSRNGRTIKTDDPLYRLYSRIWTASFPTKRLLRGTYRLISAIKRRWTA